jgi:hypothetical protein
VVFSQLTVLRLLVYSNKINFDDFVFDPAVDKFKYLRTNTFYQNNATDISTLLSLAIDAAPISTVGAPTVYSADFTMPASGSILYLVWDYRSSWYSNVLQSNSKFQHRNTDSDSDSDSWSNSDSDSPWSDSDSRLHHRLPTPDSRLTTPSPTPSPTPTPSPGPSPTPGPTPSPGPAPSPTPSCSEWTLACPSGSSGCSYSYTDCDGNTQSGVLPGDYDIDVCVLDGTTPIISNGSANNTNVVCQPTPSPSPSPTPTPTPTGPSPTPTPAANCTEWVLACPSGSGGCSFSYTNCDGDVISGSLAPDFDVDVCVLVGTTPTVTGG